MSDVDLLREAATQMRARAEAALPGRWYTEDEGTGIYNDTRGYLIALTGRDDRRVDAANGRHIASWHPAVALAVADWLDSEASAAENSSRSVRALFGGDDFAKQPQREAVTVAVTYLGGPVTPAAAPDPAASRRSAAGSTQPPVPAGGEA